MDNGQWKMDNGKWTMENVKCKMDNVKWKMDNEQGRQQIIMNYELLEQREPSEARLRMAES